MRRFTAWTLILIVLVVAVALAPTVAQAEDFQPRDQFQAFLYRLGEAGAQNYGDFLIVYLPHFGLSASDRTYLADSFAGLPHTSSTWQTWLLGFENSMRP